MNTSLRTPLYVRHQTAADLGNWSVTRDIAWDRVPKQGQSATQIPQDALRDACLTEAAQLVTLSRLAADVASDMDASVAVAIISQESAKHFHALRLYLDSCEARPFLSDADVADARAKVANFPHRLDTLEASVGLLKSMHMASHHYRALAQRSREPILRDLLRLIAADKVRHGRMAADVLEGWVESDRTLAPRVKGAASRLEALNRGMEPMGKRGWPSAEQAPLRTLVMRLERICDRIWVQDLRPITLDANSWAAAG